MIKSFLSIPGLFFILSLSVYGQGFSFYEYYPPEVYGEHPQNWAAQQDTNGFMFIGNGDGLVMFDGLNWTQKHIGESGRVQSFFRSKSGQLYVNGHSSFGIVLPDTLNQITFESISDQFYGPNDSKPYIWETYEIGNLIYYRHNRGIAVYNPYENTLSDHVPPGYSGYLWTSFQVGDSIITDTDEGLWAFHDSTFSRIEKGSLLKDLRLFFAIPIDSGSFLLGSTNSESPYRYRRSYLHLYDGETIQPFESEAMEYLSQNQLFNAIKIAEDRFAIATLSGGVVFINSDGELLKIFTERTGLHSNAVFNLYLDHENILWITLSEGIQKLDLNEHILQFSESSGINGVVRDVAVQGEDKFVLTQSDGLFINTVLETENVDFFESLDLGVQISKLFTWQGKVFAYGTDGLFSLSKDGVEQKYYDGEINTLVDSGQDRSELIFLATNKQLIFDGNRILETPVNFPGIPRNGALYYNEIFTVIGNDRIYKIEGNRTINIPIEFDTTASILINKMDRIGEKLYLGSEGGGQNMGLFEYVPESESFVKSGFLIEHADFDNKQVFNFKGCRDGSTWFLANKKIIRISRVNDSWDVRSSPYQKAKTGTYYSITCADNGVWFGGTNGLVFINDTDWNYKTDFKTNVTGALVRGDSLIFGGYGKPTNEIILPYRDNELRFTYAAASFVSPERNQYQVKLEGFDQNWSNWTSETQKDYTNIPEGEYTFLARSKNVYDVEGSTAAIPLSILPPWYRTWWAYLLYTLTIMGFLYTAYKIRVNQLLRVERIRNNIASDLHDEVSATLSSISYFAEAIQSDKMKKDKDRFVKLIANSAGDAKEKITDIVWAINPEHDDWQAFLSKCRRYASDLLESKGMKYSLKIDEHIPGKLDMQLRQHLWLIFKEMVTNAARHSGAKQLDVIMNYENGRLKLVVQDDGKGMDIDKVKKGNGLVNIQKRADLIGGDISLKTSEGFGTRWILKVSI